MIDRSSLADKIELHLNLDKGSPGFHLSKDDFREIVSALRSGKLYGDLADHIGALEAEIERLNSVLNAYVERQR